MNDRRIQSIAILGGGTAGWIAASMLARALTGTGRSVTLIESAEIGTIGVGEATVPPIVDLLRYLSINEADFVAHTQATYKLGIEFRDWRTIGERFFHPFGQFGVSINRRPFVHYCHRLAAQGRKPKLGEYNLCTALALREKFLFPEPIGPRSGIGYALHFDAMLVARYLRTYAEKLGVVRLEGKAVSAKRTETGLIEALILENGTSVAADFFIDCSGFRGVLIEDTLKTGYLDWTQWLPCDRAVAFPTENGPTLPPYTRATARSAGWQWRIPLQSRAGNGHVYSSAHLSDQAALDDLLSCLGQQPLADPRFLRFTTGRRKQFWVGNCLALGLASGFLEPLESTSIQLIISGLYKLIEHFPDRGFAATNIAAYNASAAREYEIFRDFIILHYHLNGRGEPLWRQCREMTVPESLQERIDAYRQTGRMRIEGPDLFRELSWYSIFSGMGVEPDSYDPMTDVVPMEKLEEILASLRRDIAETIA